MTEKKKKILITGAAGRIGRYLTQYLGEKYALVLTDNREPEQPAGLHFVKADLTDMAAMRALCVGVDTVVHLAADPRVHATWEELYPANIVGVYNLFEAAYEAGCRRIIFASSINAVSGYPQEIQIEDDVLPRPPNLYGATKVWGETIGSYYADQKGLSAICLRIGWVVAADREWQKTENDYLSMATTYRDLAQLFSLCIAAPDELRFGIFNGISDNRCKRLDISKARAVLGYEPQDDAYVLAGVDGEQQS